ncbi:MAG: aspartate/glutamate racemase family protein [Emergencia sp.]
MDRMIGILGGMGPKASQLFYDMVTEMTDADKDQDHVRMMIYSDPSIPDRTQAILRGEYDQVYEKMLKNALTLEAAGCEAIGITCNTAHFFAEMIADKLNIPIIHMIAHTVFHIKRRNPGAKIAILATEGTIKTQLYQRQMEQGGLIPYVLAPEIQELVSYQIYDRIKKGLDWDEAAWGTIEDVIKKEGCQGAIMGCTELSVIKAENGLSDYYIDPMEVLAGEVIRFSGKKEKNKVKIGTNRL